VSDQTPPAQASTPDPGESAPPPGEDHDFVGPQAPEALPASTTATRGRHFSQLVSSTVTLVLTAILAAVAVIVGATQGVIAAGLGGAVVVVLLALLICFLMAGSRARSDFYTAYADGRSLTRSNGRTSLPPVTALLQRGDDRYAEEAFSGGLPGGLQGQLAFYTYEEESRDSDGNKETTYYHFTVAITNLPETAPVIGELAMQRRSGFRFLDGAEDKFRKRQRVELESEAADKKYEIFIGKDDSMIVARQIFSPTFIVWMSDNAPDGIACELLGGGLCVNVKGHKKTADELDEFCVAASAIAKRLHEEAGQKITS
jgi:hypothetical protein